MSVKIWDLSSKNPFVMIFSLMLTISYAPHFVWSRVFCTLINLLSWIKGGDKTVQSTK